MDKDDMHGSNIVPDLKQADYPYWTVALPGLSLPKSSAYTHTWQLSAGPTR